MGYGVFVEVGYVFTTDEHGNDVLMNRYVYAGGNFLLQCLDENGIILWGDDCAGLPDIDVEELKEAIKNCEDTKCCKELEGLLGLLKLYGLDDKEYVTVYIL